MIRLRMGSSPCLKKQNSQGFKFDLGSDNVGVKDNDDDSISSSINSSEVSSAAESDLIDEATSSASSSSSTSPGQLATDPLHDMSSLMKQLPLKRGLSKFYQGKSQSYACISNVRCLEDLAKPEKPYCNKRLKSCKSYGGLSDESQIRSSSQLPGEDATASSRFISKKATCSSLINAKRNVRFLDNRPPSIPPPPPRSTSTNNFSNQTPLFA